MINTTELILACRKVRDERPKTINTLSGLHGVYYTHNEAGDELAVIGLNFPEGIFVDVDMADGDANELTGIIIFLSGPNKFDL